MKTRNSALYALGLAAAITLGGAITAGLFKFVGEKNQHSNQYSVFSDQ